jgi:UDP-N-acetylglucosamine--N-acetylmuramyl-(pentapeptide) pyrophosphoryl-undecaprenol N-acetylglucosamine transferase
MHVIFAGGGTGGHLYPGLAIARAMQRADSRVEPFFIGAKRGIESSVLPDAGFPFELLELHPLYRSRPWENWKTLAGGITAWSRFGAIISQKVPKAIVGTGGYASGVALAYASLHGIPFALQEQNSFPGLTTRFFSRYARQVHTGFPEAARKLSPGRRTRIFDSGNPIEPPPDIRPSRPDARRAWGFPETGGHVMLVYGGSQGSKAINDAVARWVTGLPAGLFVIWATGRKTFDDYAPLESAAVRVRPYLAPVADAYSAADFALSRGGAIATAELCAWGIPPIVVPLPTAAADHQTANAIALSEAGAAVMIRQSDLTTETLERAVIEMIQPATLAARSAAVAKRARPRAADDIAGHILEMINASA